MVAPISQDPRRSRPTAIVTGASRGLGAGIAKALVNCGFSVVLSSRSIGTSSEIAASSGVALVDGDIADRSTAVRLVEIAVERFGSLDVLVNNAGLFCTKAFTDYTTDEVRALLATNVEGFLHVTQLAIRAMLAQGRGGSIVNVGASLASNPMRSVNAAVPMLTKGGLETITRHLALEYARERIRVNAVAPGTIPTALHAGTPREVLAGSSPMGQLTTVEDVASAVVYLVGARAVTGDVLFVDGGAHLGRW